MTLQLAPSIATAITWHKPRSSGMLCSLRSCKSYNGRLVEIVDLIVHIRRIAIPWFTVRKVPVEITTPSPKVAVIKLRKGIQQGLLGRVSRSATMEYHGFGIISEGIESNAHYIIAGVQGDWTRGLVADPPKFLYTREMKVGRTTPHLVSAHSYIASYSSLASLT
jgi:hypothetical protein